MTQYGTWVPYAGIDAVLLGVTLLAVGVIFVYLGMRLKRSVGVKRPGKAVSVFMILMWALSLATFLIAVVTYGLQLYQEHMLSATPTNPITPITELCGLVTFIIIAYLARSHGLKVALGSAFVGTAAAPMIFELPFDLIVMSRTYPPIPPAPSLYRLLFFLPLFLVEISTFSFLTLSPLTKLSKYTLFSLAGMFFVFAVWALLGFSYPSDPVLVTLNGLSKILSFVTAMTLFIRSK
ncbi:MAG: hypothetical protein ABSE39_10255 [Candidatus Bathyarchaeia archaeon]|jgi:hypothetical protein